MTTQQNILGLVNLRREIGGPAAIGVKLLHKPAVRVADIVGARPGSKPKNLFGLLLRHWTLSRRDLSSPRCRVRVHALTPAGKSAVKIRV